jgi:hypothetical protein
MSVDSPSVSTEDRCAAVRLRLDPSPLGDAELAVQLDLQFADEWIDLEARRYLFLREKWRFRFALAGGELLITLKGLLSPMGKRSFRQRVSSLPGTHASPGQTTSPAFTAGGLGVAATSAAGLPGAAIRPYSAYTRGGDAAPIWVFRANHGTSLVGLIRAQLATFDIADRPYLARARFTATAEMIRIEEIDSPRFPALSSRRRAVLRQLMIEYVHGLAQEYLSEARITSES